MPDSPSLQSHPLTVELSDQPDSPGVLTVGGPRLEILDDGAVVAWIAARAKGLTVGLKTDVLVMRVVIPWTAPTLGVPISWSPIGDGSSQSIQVPPTLIVPAHGPSSDVRWTRKGILYSILVTTVADQAPGQNGTIFRPRREGPK
ncbi:hypothetical protein ACNOYE_12585 [Nannocystaceae bacterium ST9]